MQPRFVVGRGFRVVKLHLKDHNFRVLMPRFTTKVRCTVAALHDMLKIKYQLPNKQLDNKALQNLKVTLEYLRFFRTILVKVLNCYANIVPKH